MIIDDKVLFTSDTGFDPEFLQTLDDDFKFEHIFHECQRFNDGVRSSIQVLVSLPTNLKNKTLLMDYGDALRDFAAQSLEAGFDA